MKKIEKLFLYLKIYIHTYLSTALTLLLRSKCLKIMVYVPYKHQIQRTRKIDSNRTKEKPLTNKRPKIVYIFNSGAKHKISGKNEGYVNTLSTTTRKKIYTAVDPIYYLNIHPM